MRPRPLLRLLAVVLAGAAHAAAARPLAAQSQTSPSPTEPRSWYGVSVSAPGQPTVGGWGVGSASVSGRTPDGEGAASADARTGTIRASARSAQIPPRLDQDWEVWARAGFWGAVDITPSALNPDRLVTWELQITGQRGPGRLAGSGNGYGAWYFGTNVNRFSSASSNPVTLQNRDTVRIRGSFELPEDQPLGYTRMYAYAGLSVMGHGSGWADYGNTVHLSWTVPHGATVSMPVGEFLAPTVRPLTTVTPEPAPLALLAGGAAGVGVLARRRTRRVPNAPRG